MFLSRYLVGFMDQRNGPDGAKALEQPLQGLEAAAVAKGPRIDRQDLCPLAPHLQEQQQNQ